MSEEERWVSFVKGDELSFKQIYDIHYTVLHSYATKLCKDEYLADECIQDLFIKLWRNRESIGTPDSPKYYLLKAIRNIIYNKLKQRDNSSEVSLEEVPESLLGAALPEIPFQNQVPLSPFLNQLMRVLTDRQREAIYLFYVESLSYQEIAEHLQIQKKAAYKLVYRAIDKLKNGLKV